MSKISDDGTLEAALYGTAHMPTRLALGDCDRLSETLKDSAVEALADIDDLDLAEEVLVNSPELVYDDSPVPEGLDPVLEETVVLLRRIAKDIMAQRLVTQWGLGADARGRQIGLAEHSARVVSDGTGDRDQAVSRFGEVDSE